MEFLNPEIDLTSIPRAEAVSFNPAAPEYFKVLRTWWLITCLVLTAILVTLLITVPYLQKLPFVIVAIGLMMAYAPISYYLERKAFLNLGFAIREHDVIHRSGWFITHIRTAPFNRVQHSNVIMGPLERKFGLATLVLYTAGTEGADIKISGLRKEEAYQLKDWITKKLQHEG